VRPLTVLSLFDGISCGQIALARAGITVKQYFASEIDKHAIKVTQSQYPDTIQLGDILDLELTITEIFGFDSRYGYCLAHKFEDADGNSLIYFGNSKQLCSDSDSKFKEGDKITITAEIKRHTKDQRDFVFDNGFDQVMKPLTVLSKPKLIK